MSERQAFLEAICREPAEDVHRLVFADWLDEHGEPERAEFIRVQCELARTDPFDGWECKVCGNRPVLEGDFDGGVCAHGKGCYTLFEDGGGDEFIETSERYRELRRRERELFPCLYRSGLPGSFIPNLDGLTGRPGPHAHYRRGFAEHVFNITAADWLQHADSILRENPVTKVTLTTMPRCEVWGDGVTTLTYAVEGLEGEYDLFAIREALGVTDAPRALRVNEVMLGIFAIRFRGIEFTLPPAFVAAY